MNLKFGKGFFLKKICMSYMYLKNRKNYVIHFRILKKMFHIKLVDNFKDNAVKV